MIATALLYLQSKFELTRVNTCGSVMVCIGICFVAASQNGEEKL
jgi:hypothetical protein